MVQILALHCDLYRTVLTAVRRSACANTTTASVGGSRSRGPDSQGKDLRARGPIPNGQETS